MKTFVKKKEENSEDTAELIKHDAEDKAMNTESISPEEPKEDKEASLSVQQKEIEEGDYVLLSGCRSGLVRFVGPVDFSPSSIVVGVELDEGQVGRCNGTVGGKTYFECPERKGIFVLQSQIEHVVHGKKKRIKLENMRLQTLSDDATDLTDDSLKHFVTPITETPRSDDESEAVLYHPQTMTEECLKRVALRIKMSRTCVFVYIFLFTFNVVTILWEVLSDTNHIAVMIVEIFITFSLVCDLLLDMFIEGKNYWKDWMNYVDIIVCMFCIFAVLGLIVDEIHGLHGFETYIDEILIAFRYLFRMIRLCIFLKRGKMSHTILRQTDDVDFGMTYDFELESDKDEDKNL